MLLRDLLSKLVGAALIFTFSIPAQAGYAYKFKCIPLLEMLARRHSHEIESRSKELTEALVKIIRDEGTVSVRESTGELQLPQTLESKVLAKELEALNRQLEDIPLQKQRSEIGSPTYAKVNAAESAVEIFERDARRIEKISETQVRAAEARATLDRATRKNTSLAKRFNTDIKETGKSIIITARVAEAIAESTELPDPLYSNRKQLVIERLAMQCDLLTSQFAAMQGINLTLAQAITSSQEAIQMYDALKKASTALELFLNSISGRPQ